MKPFLVELDYSNLEKRILNLSMIIDLNKHRSHNYTALKEFKELLLFLKKKPKIFNMFEQLIYDYDYIYFKSRKILEQLILTKRELLKDKKEVELKKYYENDVKFVKQIPEVYPILFNYEKFIRKEIFEANYRKFNKIIFFKYISDLTGGFKKWTAIKKYYYDKYLDLIKWI